MAEFQIIKKKDRILAMILRNNYNENGVKFLTPDE